MAVTPAAGNSATRGSTRLRSRSSNPSSPLKTAGNGKTTSTRARSPATKKAPDGSPRVSARSRSPARSRSSSQSRTRSRSRSRPAAASSSLPATKGAGGGGAVSPKGKLAAWQRPRLGSWNDIPAWYRDNEFILNWYRLPTGNYTSLLRSIFQVHNETGNIWTHGLGVIGYFWLLVYTLVFVVYDQHWSHSFVFTVYLGSAIYCLLCSTTFHTIFCHSRPVFDVAYCLDYAGIAVLITGSSFPPVYYAFYCRPQLQVSCLSLVFVIGVAGTMVQFIKEFRQPKYRGLRAGLFIAMGFAGAALPGGFIVYLHWSVDSGPYHLSQYIPMIIMACFYIGGVGFYATRFPEKYFPGTFDLIGHSHQIHHCAVLIAVACHYYGSLNQFYSLKHHNALHCDSHIHGLVSADIELEPPLQDDGVALELWKWVSSSWA